MICILKCGAQNRMVPQDGLFHTGIHYVRAQWTLASYDLRQILTLHSLHNSHILKHQQKL